MGNLTISKQGEGERPGDIQDQRPTRGNWAEDVRPQDTEGHHPMRGRHVGGESWQSVERKGARQYVSQPPFAAADTLYRQPWAGEERWQHEVPFEHPSRGHMGHAGAGPTPFPWSEMAPPNYPTRGYAGNPRGHRLPELANYFAAVDGHRVLPYSRGALPQQKWRRAGVRAAEIFGTRWTTARPDVQTERVDDDIGQAGGTFSAAPR
mmetsp:Transcript_14450/g.42655  ORF Transcript_14450/g.42655 Transcript_14450/m.42655 type:complete len:207 (-) Transcript_14450:302-922(-)